VVACFALNQGGKLESFTSSLFVLYFLTGLTVGVSHCLGMCGPIMMAVSMRAKGGSVFPSLALYHSGRILTYSLLGGIMGFLGSAAAVTAFMMGLKPAILFGAGILIIFMGLAMTGLIPGIRFFSKDPGGGEFFTGKIWSSVRGKQPLSFFVLGLLLGFLPCGPVYVALAAAAGSGAGGGGAFHGMISGVGVMACFGLGTTPALFLLGKLSALKVLANRVLIYRIAGVIVILSGVRFIVKAALL
jgi:hypothetical protein